MAMLNLLRKNLTTKAVGHCYAYVWGARVAIASHQCCLGSNPGGDDQVPKKKTFVSRGIIRNNIFNIL